jgi:hypothetical protein
LLGFVEGAFRLCGQAVEWAYACSDDRSGSEQI